MKVKLAVKSQKKELFHHRLGLGLVMLPPLPRATLPATQASTQHQAEARLALSHCCWLTLGGELSGAVLLFTCRDGAWLPWLVPWTAVGLWLIRGRRLGGGGGWFGWLGWAVGWIGWVVWWWVGPLCSAPLGAGFCTSVVLVVALPGPWTCGVPAGCSSLLGVVSWVNPCQEYEFKSMSFEFFFEKTNHTRMSPFSFTIFNHLQLVNSRIQIFRHHDNPTNLATILWKLWQINHTNKIWFGSIGDSPFITLS